MVASVVVILRPSEAVLPGFLIAYLSSGRHLALANLLARGTTMQRLSRSQVGDMPVALPPLPVQQEVLEKVSQIHRRTADVRGPLLRQIALLQERRQALITAAVTGELDIAGAA
jgi:type I restriction enzyme S subunit